MKEVTVKVPNKHYKFFNELIDQLGYVEKVKPAAQKPLTAAQQKTLKGIERGLREMQLVNQGKLKTKSARDLLNEL